ncbi:hypothetical protein ES702_04425 [subsurface metagenome]
MVLYDQVNELERVKDTLKELTPVELIGLYVDAKTRRKGALNRLPAGMVENISGGISQALKIL